METTNGNNNPQLWKDLSPSDAVFEPIRVMVANRLATSGKEWTQTFAQYNSGTCVCISAHRHIKFCVVYIIIVSLY